MKYPFLVLFTLFALSLYSQNKPGASIFVQQNQNVGIVGGIGIEYWKGKSRFNLKFGTQNYIPKKETLFIPEQSDFTRQDSLPMIWSNMNNTMPVFVGIGYSRQIVKIKQRVCLYLGIDVGYFQRQTNIVNTLIGITADGGVMPADAKLAAEYYFRRNEQTTITAQSISLPITIDYYISSKCSIQIYTSLGYQLNTSIFKLSRYQDGYTNSYIDVPEYTNTFTKKSNAFGSINNYGLSITYKL